MRRIPSKRIVRMIVEYLPFAGVVVSIAALILELMRPEPGILQMATVIILGILSLAMLVERVGIMRVIEKRMEKIDEVRNVLAITHRIEEKMETIQGARDLLTIPPGWTDFEFYARHAGEIWVSGGSLHKLIDTYHTELSRLCRENGCSFRFLLVDPDSLGLDAISRWCGKLNVDIFRDDIERSIAHLEAMVRESPRGKIRVKLNQSIPALTATFFDPRTLSGRIRLDIQLFRCEAPHRPCVELTYSKNDAQRDAVLKDFLRQYEDLWRDSITLTRWRARRDGRRRFGTEHKSSAPPVHAALNTVPPEQFSRRDSTELRPFDRSESPAKRVPSRRPRHQEATPPI